MQTTTKLKQQWDTTTHLLEWLKSGTLKITNAGEDVEHHELSSIVGGNEKWYSHFGSLTVFYNTTYTLTLVTEMVLGAYSKELSIYVHTKTAPGYL